MQQGQVPSQQEETLSSHQEIRGGEKLRPGRKPRHIGRTIAIILLLFIVAGIATYMLLPMKLGYTVLQEKHTFFVQHSPQLIVHDNRAGTITIHPARTDDAIYVTMTTHKGMLTAASGLSYASNSGFVELYLPLWEDGSADSDSSFDLDLTVPQNTNLQIEAGKAAITINDITAKANITATTSPIALHHVTLVDHGAITSKAGTINLTDVALAQGASYAISTASGKLAASFMPDQAARIDAVAVYGHIRSTLPALIVANEGRYGQHARGVIGDKQTKATIILHTDTGSIALLKAGEE
jgi:hypothetical protein